MLVIIIKHENHHFVQTIRLGHFSYSSSSNNSSRNTTGSASAYKNANIPIQKHEHAHFQQEICEQMKSSSPMEIITKRTNTTEHQHQLNEALISVLFYTVFVQFRSQVVSILFWGSSFLSCSAKLMNSPVMFLTIITIITCFSFCTHTHLALMHGMNYLQAKTLTNPHTLAIVLFRFKMCAI